MLGQVIVDDQDVLALVHEVFTHGAACVGGDILQRRQLGRGGADNGCVCHSAVFLEILDQRCHGRTLLTDGNIDAQNVLALLVDDGIGGNDGLAGLAVTDDKLTLAAANRNHRVDGLNAGLQRLLDGLTVQDAGCRGFNGAIVGSINRAFVINRLAQGVDNAANQSITDRNRHNFAGAADGTAFFDAAVIAKQND